VCTCVFVSCARVCVLGGGARVDWIGGCLGGCWCMCACNVSCMCVVGHVFVRLGVCMNADFC